VPEGAKSLVLIMDDPDIPEVKKQEFDSRRSTIGYSSISAGDARDTRGAAGGRAGATTRGEPHYVGPCPPPEYEPREHRYFFRLYALGGTLRFDALPTKRQVLDALAPLLVEEAELVGRYART